VKAVLLALALVGSSAVLAQPIQPSPPARPGLALAQAAERQVGVTLLYDPAYVRLAYPGGDLPLERGVCADVVVRAFRAIGVDLQVALHEDMARSFGAYPRNWGLRRPDRNIDHRRVPNLMTYFRRQGKELPISRSGTDYLPGDIVAWDLGHGVTHIGIVSDEKALLPTRYKVIHNIGRGVEIADMLFEFRIIGHYRYFA